MFSNELRYLSTWAVSYDVGGHRLFVVCVGSEWQRVSINGVTLPEALKCWEDGRQETNHYEQSPKKDNVADRFIHRLITG